MADGVISIDVELNDVEFKSSLENMGKAVQTGSDTIIKSIENLTKSFVVFPDTINSAVTQKLIGFIPGMQKAGSEFFAALATDMPVIIENIKKKIPQITDGIVIGIKDGIPLMAKAGYELFGAITTNVPLAVKEILKAPKEIMNLLYKEFTGLATQFNIIGESVVRGIWAGMSGLGGWLVNMVTNFVNNMVSSAMKALGISSPSKVFRDLIGKNIALGIGVGIEDEMPDVIDETKMQIDKLVNAASQSSRLTVGGSSDISGIISHSGIGEIQETRWMLKNQFEGGNINGNNAMPEINIVLEPAGDLRGFFDYISMGVKRSDYLRGET